MPDYHPSDRVLAIAEAMHEADNYFVSYDQARAALETREAGVSSEGK